jgi:hypothetical protein
MSVLDGDGDGDGVGDPLGDGLALGDGAAGDESGGNGVWS